MGLIVGNVKQSIISISQFLRNPRVAQPSCVDSVFHLLLWSKGYPGLQTEVLMGAKKCLFLT